jgi:hypothetical protein
MAQKKGKCWNLHSWIHVYSISLIFRIKLFSCWLFLSINFTFCHYYICESEMSMNVKSIARWLKHAEPEDCIWCCHNTSCSWKIRILFSKA